MKKNKNNDFFRPQMAAAKAAQAQLDLANSIQSRLNIANSIPHDLKLIGTTHPQIVAAASVKSPGAFSAAIVPVYKKPAILQSIEPFLAAHKEIARSFRSIPHYYVESPAFSALATNVSKLVRSSNLPIQQIYVSSQMLANALQRHNDIASIFASNIENITISPEQDSDSFIDLPESVAEFISDIDDSIELPAPNADRIVHVNKSNLDAFSLVLTVLCTVLSIISATYLSAESTALSIQQHKERMKQNQQHHEEQMQQDDRQFKRLLQEEQKQTQLLEQLLDALTSIPDDHSQVSEDTDKCPHVQQTKE